jgi:hypothetical protein
VCQSNNGGCDVNAVCVAVGQYNVACTCKPGFSGPGANGYYCPAENVAPNTLCRTNNGGCDVNADCVPVGQYNVKCTCRAAFSGPGANGFYCPALSSGTGSTGSTGSNNGGTGNNGGNGAPQFGNWDCPPNGGFWDWRYPQPACDRLTVTYPADLPADQANDVNVRIHTPSGDITLNFHNNDGFWSGVTVFNFFSHPLFPAGLTQWSIVWVQVGGSNCHWHGDVQCGVTPEEPETGAELPFNWDWEYPAPTCNGVTVTYPTNIPDCQANDANVRIVTNLSPIPVTLNFHLEQTTSCVTWTGTHTFDIVGHPGFPAGATSYTIVWVQIAGTNYHWQGSVVCT